MVFFKILQNSQGNTCARVYLSVKLKASSLRIYSKRESYTGVSLGTSFPLNFIRYLIISIFGNYLRKVPCKLCEVYKYWLHTLSNNSIKGQLSRVTMHLQDRPQSVSLQLYQDGAPLRLFLSNFWGLSKQIVLCISNRFISN